jgi:hypothetical protein
MSWDQTRKRIQEHCYRNKRLLMRTEKKAIETPTEELKLEVARIQGVQIGLKKALQVIEIAAQEPELPLLGEFRLS